MPHLPELVITAIVRDNVTMFKLLYLHYLHYTEAHRDSVQLKMEFMGYFTVYCCLAASYNRVTIVKFIDMGHVSKKEQFRRFGRSGGSAGNGDGKICKQTRLSMLNLCMLQNSVDVLDYIWNSSSVGWPQNDIHTMRTEHAPGFTRRMDDWWQHRDSLDSLGSRGSGNHKRKNLL